jgi:ligand-binding sensor domain-containing protein
MMKYIKIIPALFIVLLWTCKKDDDTPEKEIVQEINAEVNAIAVDIDNTKWIGTNEGLYKSVNDGYELQELSVSGKIYSLYYEANADILWIGTEGGLLKAAIGGDNISESSIDNENLSDPKVLTFYFDDVLRHWFGTEKGITMSHEDTWKKENFRINALEQLFPMDIEDYAVNSIASWDGDYFFATSGVKLYRAFNYDSSVDAFSGATQWDSPYNGQNISDTMFVVFIDNEGKQWMGGTEGLQVHTGHDPLTNLTSYYDELPDNYVFDVNQAPNGDIWVCTREGIGIFNGTGWEILTEGLPDLYVTSIAFDNDGSAWIGTKKGLVNIE